ncbi:major facilitator superfamily domain-containing protein [Penicillium longicatenatum]|uniref:major facilitator superfamily domain-containing protein n=1 Tax=Penicillium longicatenatum TaxID=1561947 RepID=UPI0025479D95|nr:major facilitator superfamily domain-containing protein [Penicillium longicatenatum]KAJ5661385.1 major facilitator superfamily domain-containing protein [Penicillium longicatenatum]
MPQSLNNPHGGDESGSTKTRLKSIDFSGITIFVVAVLSFLFAIHNFNFGEAQQSQLFYVSSATFIISLALLFLVELLWATNPLIPLDLMLTSFGAYCLSQQLINMGRSAFIPTTTPYFIRVFNVSDFTASMVNMLIMAGVPTGGYFAGYLIRRRKIGVITACFMGLIYLLIFLRWRAPCLPWETVYLIPFGFTMGILFSTQFVGMTTTVIEARIGQCIGTYALFGQLGAVIGPLLGLKLVDFIFQRKLYREIPSSSEKPALVHKVLNDARFAFKLPESTQNIIRQSYLSSFQFMPSRSAHIIHDISKVEGVYFVRLV